MPLPKQNKIDLYINVFKQELVAELLFIVAVEAGRATGRRPLWDKMKSAMKTAGVIAAATTATSLLPLSALSGLLAAGSAKALRALGPSASDKGRQSDVIEEEIEEAAIDKATMLVGEESAATYFDLAGQDSAVLERLAEQVARQAAARYQYFIETQLSDEATEGVVPFARCGVIRALQYLCQQLQSPQAAQNQALSIESILLEGLVEGYSGKWISGLSNTALKGLDGTPWAKTQLTAEAAYAQSMPVQLAAAQAPAFGYPVPQAGKQVRRTVNRMKAYFDKGNASNTAIVALGDNKQPRYGYRLLEPEAELPFGFKRLDLLPAERSTRLDANAIKTTWATYQTQQSRFMPADKATLERYLTALADGTTPYHCFNDYVANAKDTPRQAICFHQDLRGLSWQGQDTGPRPDFSQVDFSGCLLSGDISGVNFQKSNFYQARFINVIGKQPNFGEANLAFVIARGINLTDANFTQAQASYGDFTNAVIDTEQLAGSHWAGAELSGVQWHQGVTEAVLDVLTSKQTQLDERTTALEEEASQLREAFVTWTETLSETLDERDASLMTEVEAYVQAQWSRLALQSYCEQHDMGEEAAALMAEMKTAASQQQVFDERLNALEEQVTAHEGRLGDVETQQAEQGKDIEALKAALQEAEAPLTEAQLAWIQSEYKAIILKDDTITLIEAGHMAKGDIIINIAIVKETEQKLKEKEGADAKDASKDADNAVQAQSLLATYEDIHQPKKPILLEDLFKARVKKNKDTKRELGTEGSANADAQPGGKAKQEPPPNRVMLTGRAGVGKSTVCECSSYRWANGSLWARTEADETGFDWVFHLSLKTIPAHYQDIESQREKHHIGFILFREWFSQPPFEFSEAKTKQFWQAIKDQRILWLLDGYDEVEQLHHPLIEKVLLAQPRVLLTSRPYAAKRQDMDEKIEALGFTSKNITDYTTLLYGPKFYDRAPEGEALLTWLNRERKIKGLCAVPIFLELLCGIWHSDREKIEGKADEAQASTVLLYTLLTAKFWKRYLQRYTQSLALSTSAKNQRLVAIDNLTDNRVLTHFKIQETATFLNFLAFEGLIAGRLIIGHDVVSHVIDTVTTQPSFNVEGESNFISDIQSAGFLKAVGEAKQAMGQDYYFIHLSLQEFLAAKHVVWGLTLPTGEGKEKDKNEKIRQEVVQFICENKYNPQLQLLWEYVAGLLNQMDEAQHLQRFFEILLTEPRDLFGLYEVLLHIRLLEACQGGVRLEPRMQKALIDHIHGWMNTAIQRSDSESSFNIDKLLTDALQHAPNIALGYLQNQTFQNCFKLKKKSRAAIIVLRAIRQAVPRETPAIVLLLLAVLKDKNSRSEVSDTASSALNAIVEAARSSEASAIAEAFLAAVKDEERGIRRAAIKFLSAIAKAAPREAPAIAEVLLAALKDKDSGVRVAASVVLLELGEAALSEASAIAEAFLAAVKDEEREVRRTAIRFLGAFAKAAPREAPAIAEVFFVALKDKDREVRVAASVVLLELGEPALREAPAIAEVLLAALKAKDREVRGVVIWALGELGKAAPSEAPAIVPVLLAAMKKERTGLHHVAGKALDEILKATPREAPAIAPVLLAALKDKDREVRCAASWALGRLGEAALSEAPAIAEALLVAQKDKKREVRDTAREVLGVIVKSAPSEAPAIAPVLLAALKDECSAVRCAAIRALGQLGEAALSDALAIVEALLAALKDKDSGVRYDAREVLGVIVKSAPSEAPAIVPVFLAAQKDEELEVRRTARQVLGVIVKSAPREASAIAPVLLAALKDECSAVCSAASWALGELGKAAPSEAAAIVPVLLAAVKDERSAVRGVVIRALGELGEAAPSEAPAIVPVVLAAVKDERSAVRGAAILALGELGKAAPREAPAIVSVVLAAVNDERSAVRDTAYKALSEIFKATPREASAIVPVVLAALKDECSAVCCAASWALGELGKAAPSEAAAIVPVLLAALKEEKTGVRDTAYKALGEIVKAAPSEASAIAPALLAALKDECSAVCCAASWALGELGKAAPSEAAAIVPVLLAALKEEKTGVRDTAYKALGEIVKAAPSEASAIAPVLLAAVKDECSAVRCAASWALGRLGEATLSEASAIVPVLLAAVKDEEGEVRCAAIRALGELGKAAPREALAIVPVLLAALKDEEGEVRCAASWALGELGKAAPSEAPAIVPVLLAAVKDERSAVRGAAIRALGQLGKAAPSEAAAIVPVLLVAVNDERSAVCCAASWALGELGKAAPSEAAAIVPVLLAALKEEKTGVHDTAYKALGEIVKAAPREASAIAPVLLAALKDECSAVRCAASWALGRLGKVAPREAPAIVPVLLAAVKDERSAVRGAVIQALGELGKAAPSEAAAIAEVLLAALKDEKRVVRDTAYKALDEIVSDARWRRAEGPAAIILPALLVALKDEEREIRCAAIRHLSDLFKTRSLSVFVKAALSNALAIVEALLVASKDSEVSYAATTLLHQIVSQARWSDVPAAATVPALLAALKYAGVRNAADDALREITWDAPEEAPAIVEACLAAVKDEECAVRRAAIEALGTLVWAAPEEASAIMEALLAAVKDEECEVRRAAIRALGRLVWAAPKEAPIIVPLLQAAAKGRDRWVRREAIGALGQAFHALSNEPPDIQRGILKAIEPKYFQSIENISKLSPDVLLCYYTPSAVHHKKGVCSRLLENLSMYQIAVYEEYNNQGERMLSMFYAGRKHSQVIPDNPNQRLNDLSSLQYHKIEYTSKGKARQKGKTRTAETHTSFFRSQELLQQDQAEPVAAKLPAFASR